MHKIHDDDHTPEGGYPADALTCKDEPLDMNMGNISAQSGHESGLSSSHNLFDDLNSEDSKWVQIARGHLKKRASSKGPPPQSI